MVSIAPATRAREMPDLIYSVPERLGARIREGATVLVPLSGRKVMGIVLGTIPRPTDLELRKVKDILDIVDEVPILQSDIREVVGWAAEYYFSSLGAAYRMLLPSKVPSESVIWVSVRRRGGTDGGARGVDVDAVAREIFGYVSGRKRTTVRALRRRFGGGVVTRSLATLQSAEMITVKERFARPAIREPSEGAGLKYGGATDVGGEGMPADLTAAQQKAAGAITKCLENQEFVVYQLYGVTGSGKTEVYLRAASHAIKKGKSALFLVPEISLTRQVVLQVRSRFGLGVAVLHSGLKDAERWREWNRIASGDVNIVVGARSSVFAPLPNLGLIVVDEEHEPAYKQEDGMRYNARDVAIVRAKLSKCPVVLGSATPSLESYAQTQTSKYAALCLPERVAKRALPRVEIVDLRREVRRGQGALIFSDLLAKAIKANYDAKKQTVLFLNRRGYENYLQCGSCGEALSCPNCSVTLTHHAKRKQLSCHYCGFVRKSLKKCPACNEPSLEGNGVGTEQVEDALREMIPQARIARLDRDSTKSRGTLDRVLASWAAHEYDVLIGTQMVAKGHDVAGVTLVGVILADTTLNRPDFRAAERTFQLLAQVAGRAGRGADEGKVIIQTFVPRHYSIQCAARHDYHGFAAEELRYRRHLGYPPYRRLINVRFEGKNGDEVQAVAHSYSDIIDRVLRSREFCMKFENGSDERPVVLGPAPAPIERIKQRDRWQLLLKGPNRSLLHAVVEKAEEAFSVTKMPRTVRTIIDVDPYSMV